MREERAGQVDVEEGLRSGQLRDGGLLWEAQERVLPSPRLAGGVGAGVLPHAWRLPEVLQRGAAEGKAGLDGLDAVAWEPGAGGVAGPKKRPLPRCKVI